MHYVNGEYTGKGKGHESLSDTHLLWKRSKPPKIPTRYNFTRFAITLNELTPGLKVCFVNHTLFLYCHSLYYSPGKTPYYSLLVVLGCVCFNCSSLGSCNNKGKLTFSLQTQRRNKIVPYFTVHVVVYLCVSLFFLFYFFHFVRH